MIKYAYDRCGAIEIVSVVKSLFDDERVTKKLKSAELPFLEDDLLTYTEQTITGVTTEHSELLK